MTISGYGKTAKMSTTCGNGTCVGVFYPFFFLSLRHLATSSKAERVEAAQGIGDEARETKVCEYRKPLFHSTYPAETKRDNLVILVKIAATDTQRVSPLYVYIYQIGFDS